MLRGLLVLATLAGLGTYGYLRSDRARGLVEPQEIRAIECPAPLPDGTDMFQVRSARIAMRCWSSGDGEFMAKHWEKHAARNFQEPGSVNYRFRKKPLGGFDRKEPESSLHPRATEAQYTVQVNFGIEPERVVSEADYRNHEDLKIPTPAAFAAETGSDTVFHCRHPGMHYQMAPVCRVTVRSPDLYWGLAIYMARPKEPKHMTVEDLRADVTEAYALVAAHVIPARK